MPNVAVGVRGLDEIRTALRKAADAGLKKELATANKGAAEIVVRYARPNVPVGSGALLRSVRALGSQQFGRARAGTASVPYAGAIHWGRKKGNVGSPPGNRMGPNIIKGRPFLTNAAQAHQREIVGSYEDAIDRLVRSVEERNG